MIGLLWLTFGLIGAWLLGLGVVTGLHRFAFGWRLRRTGSEEDLTGAMPPQLSRAELLGSGLAIGIGLTAWLQLVWGLCGGPLTRGLSLSLAGLGVLAGLLAFWRWPRTRSGAAPPSPLVRTCQIVIGLLFVNLLAQALLTPQRLWDERAIFAIKGQRLYLDGTLHSPALLHPDFVQGHPRYPLLLPLAEQHVYQLLDRFDDRWSKAIFPLLFLGLALTYAGRLSQTFSREWGWLMAVLLASLPSLSFWEYGFQSGQADAPLACFHGISVLYLWSRLREPLSPAADAGVLTILAGLSAGLGLFTKDEGIAFLMVDALSLFLVLLWPIRLRPHWSGWARFLAGYGLSAMVIAAPWLWHRRMLPETDEMSYFSRLGGDSLRAGMATLPWILPHLAQRMFHEALTWGIHWWGVLLALVSAPLKALTAAQLFLLLDIIGALCALVLAGMIAPVTVEEHIGGSSHRFLLQIAPPAVLFVAGQWGREKAE